MILALRVVHADGSWGDLVSQLSRPGHALNFIKLSSIAFALNMYTDCVVFDIVHFRGYENCDAHWLTCLPLESHAHCLILGMPCQSFGGTKSCTPP